MMRSVPSGSPGPGAQGNLWGGVEFPENGSKPCGHPKPRLLMSPVRATKSASGPFSVRSFLSAQSRTGSPVAGTGTGGAGADSGVELADVAGNDAGRALLFAFVGNSLGDTGVLGVARKFEPEDDERSDRCMLVLTLADFCLVRCTR